MGNLAMDVDLNCCEEAVLQLCQSYNQSKPTVHDAMKDAEKLENLISSSSSIPVNLECKLLTAVANHPCFVPENSLNAEVLVNSLLPYLSSPCCWVRSLACSFLRVFTARLDPTGQHIATQGNWKWLFITAKFPHNPILHYACSSLLTEHNDKNCGTIRFVCCFLAARQKKNGYRQ